MIIEKISSLIDVIPNFPKSGVLFRDITPLLSSPGTINMVAKMMADKILSLPNKPTIIAAPESRGFIFGVALAQYLSLGFVPIRKPGKLPKDVYKRSFKLEYGQDALQVHKDSFQSHDHVLIVDDLLATGGTANACNELVNMSGAKVAGNIFLIELIGLNGRDIINEDNILSLISYP